MLSISESFPDRDRAERNDLYRSVAFYNIKLYFQIFKAIRHRVEVRHCAYRAESARGRRESARRNRFFIRKTRLSKMYMNINETGKNKYIRI